MCRGGMGVSVCCVSSCVGACALICGLHVCGQILHILMGKPLDLPNTVQMDDSPHMICVVTCNGSRAMICLSSFFCGRFLQILLGIAVIFPILGKWMIHLTTPLTKPGRALMEALIPTKKTQIFGGEAVFEVPLNFVYHFVMMFFS